MTRNSSVAEIVQAAVIGTTVSGKIGKKVLQGQVATHIQEAGLDVDLEDRQRFLREGMPAWRSKDDHLIESTAARRKIDIVVYRELQPVALIEIESDLNDLRLSGVTRRNGHYDVYSIAADEQGAFFDSYKSLERMAVAAIYHAQFVDSATYPTLDGGVARLQAIRSSDPDVHNPLALELILVSGRCRAMDCPILSRRLQSLGAQLICVTSRS